MDINNAMDCMESRRCVLEQHTSTKMIGDGSTVRSYVNYGPYGYGTVVLRFDLKKEKRHVGHGVHHRCHRHARWMGCENLP